jgi:crotonobetainyl-CoA:carnitine CoA-transferase CaiB-like acyl-CoA transferase
MGGPLQGIKVLEFSQIVAAPYAGACLADLGAEVIKIEPPGGDQARIIGGAPPLDSKIFQSLNRGKQSVVLDLQRPEAQAIVHRLAAGTDVVIINFRAGIADRLNIGYAALRAVRPAIIYVQNTAFGTSGPRANQAGSDLAMQAFAGLIAANGRVEQDGAPASIGASTLVDYFAGHAMAVGVCAALYHRERTGEGQLIDTTLLAAGMTLVQGGVMREPVMDAISWEPVRADLERLRAEGAPYAELAGRYRGRRRSAAAFPLYYSTYQAKDGGLVFGALTRANRAVIRSVLGDLHDPTDDADYDPTDPANLPVAEGCRAEIQRVLRTKTVAEWLAAFEAVNAPVTAVNFPEELADDPQVQALGMMVSVDHAATGPQQIVGPILAMSATPPAVQGAAPTLGQHTDEVLASLGLSQAQIDGLREAGVVA